jgi:hypothetical protein
MSVTYATSSYAPTCVSMEAAPPGRQLCGDSSPCFVMSIRRSAIARLP